MSELSEHTGARDGIRSDDRPIDFALFGLFGVGNIGNEASLSSALNAIKRHAPRASVVVICDRPDVVSSEHGVPAVSITWQGRFSTRANCHGWFGFYWPALEVFRWIAAYRFMNTVKCIVVPGTGILDDFGMGPHQMPYQLWRWSVTARFAGRPLLMLAIGAGPIEHRLSRWFETTHSAKRQLAELSGSILGRVYG